MIETTGWVQCDDGARLFIRRWSPGAGAPRALVHVVHGMTEHSLRYRFLAEKLCEGGIELWAADMRGHGKTADPAINGPDKGGLLGHTADRNSFFRVVADIGSIHRYMVLSTKEQYGDLPLFLMGHSWGSFLVQGYIEDPDNSAALRGCILSGTRGPGKSIALGVPLLALIALVKGRRRGSMLAQALSVGPYNRHFRPNRTPFDWLSRDKKAVDDFMADPLCGKPCSSGFYRDMIRGLVVIHRKRAIARIDKALPVYIFCGSVDPVGEMGASPARLVKAYRAAGIEDLEFVLYPEARHEPLNEINREEAAEALLNWLDRCLN
ncbi:MAG: lysophospholipase [Spirochaetaceae bacterium]|nr:lysophospholipase [Spirochaetaceae bacterium]